MDWICRQEGIEADAEALAVLAQAGEGSIRDSLSALDQAIACCGAKLNAAEVRALLGTFSLDALAGVTEALAASDSSRMLALVDELERNGHNLQHFSRELSRYFRNLLVGRIAGSDTRLIAASKAERARFAEISTAFSEEDLTRYLQLSLDLFRDLQFSLQPRFHLEIGLLKLVQAGKLVAIEEALAGLKGDREKPRRVVEAAAKNRRGATTKSKSSSHRNPQPLRGPALRAGRAKKAARPEPQSMAASVGATALAPERAPGVETVTNWRRRCMRRWWQSLA
jgi:DNA polymerase-3 subunit gamma/tau